MMEFRRICTGCKKPVNWAPLFDGDDEGTFFHISDQTPLCEDAHVDLQFREASESK